MSEPILSFIYNKSSNNTAYTGTGEADSNWNVMTLSGTADTIIFTGGGINQFLTTPTATFGSREATMRPAVGTFTVPQTYVESTVSNIMTNVPLAGKNANRYVFGAYIDGYIASDLYLEAWNDNGFDSTSLPVLSGTANYLYSMINAISTTSGSPISSWTGATASGTEGSAYLAGYDHRVRLKGADSATNEAVYFNIYVSLPYDAPYFHNQPVLSFRYLYI